jgi:hypothetical protein
VTKFASEVDMQGRFVTQIVTSAALALPVAAGAHPLEEAARQAFTLCARVGSLSVDSCANAPDSRPDQSAARTAARRAISMRDGFLAFCKSAEVPADKCLEQSELFIAGGLYRATSGVESR